MLCYARAVVVGGLDDENGLGADGVPPLLNVTLKPGFYGILVSQYQEQCVSSPQKIFRKSMVLLGLKYLYPLIRFTRGKIGKELSPASQLRVLLAKYIPPGYNSSNFTVPIVV